MCLQCSHLLQTDKISKMFFKNILGILAYDFLSIKYMFVAPLRLLINTIIFDQTIKWYVKLLLQSKKHSNHCHHKWQIDD